MTFHFPFPELFEAHINHCNELCASGVTSKFLLKKQISLSFTLIQVFLSAKFVKSLPSATRECLFLLNLKPIKGTSE